MATGLINVGILRPELAGAFGAGYRGAEQARQEQQQQQQQTELNQMKLEQLKQDAVALKDLQAKMREVGQSDDPKMFFRALIQTGKPDYMSKGYEGLQRYEELQRNQDVLRQFAPELFPGTGAAPAAAPMAPAAPGALGSGTFGITPEPANALAPPRMAAPAATNAMAPAPVAEGAPDVNALRRQLFALSSVNDPRAKAMAEVIKGQLTEAVRTPADVATMRALGYPITQAGFAAFREAQRPDRMLTPEEEAQKIRIGQATRPAAPTVNVIQEKAEAGEFGKLLVKQYDDISKQASVAARTLPSIEANLAALNKGLDTGFGTEAKAAGAKVLGALGVKDAEKFATDTQTFQSNAISAVLQKQLEQKGPQTESDAQRIEQIGAQLGKTKAANQFILDLAKEQLRRDIEQRNFYAEWKKGPGKGSFNGAEDAWFAGEGGKSLFDRPALKKYRPQEPQVLQQDRRKGLGEIFGAPQKR